MRAYLSFFRVRFLAGLQYRAAAWAGIATQIAWGGMTVLMFRAFYRSGSGDFPMPFAALSTYLWLQQAFLAMFMSWYYDEEIFDSITGGGIAYELCRPCRIYSMWFTRNMATRLAKTALRCVPVLAFAALLPPPYGISLPAGWQAGVLAPISLLMGVLVLVSFNMLVYITAFYTISPRGVRILVMSVTEFLSGAVIPIPFFPESLQPVLAVLPFASMQNTPFLIYSGYLGGVQALERIALQGVWLAALTAVGALWLRRALRRVVVQGG